MLNIEDPKLEDKNNLHGIDTESTRIDTRIDIKKPKIDIPGMGIDIDAPRINQKTNIILPSVATSLYSDMNMDINMISSKLNLPNEEIDLSHPDLKDIPSVEIEKQGTKEKEFINKVETFKPKTIIPGIDLESSVEPSSKVELEHPTIDDIPAVDLKEPEIELNKKIIFPPLDNLLKSNSLNNQIKKFSMINIPETNIYGKKELPKKNAEEPDSTFEPPQIEFESDIDQTGLMSSLISGNLENPADVENKEIKPDISKLRKSSMNK